MRAILLAPLALAACAELVGPELDPLDRLTLDQLRAQGDDPAAERPVEHLLLPRGPTDTDGLRAALLDAGFEAIRIDRRSEFETRVVFRSDGRDRSIARQIAWLEANAPSFGYVHTSWDAELRPG